MYLISVFIYQSSCPFLSDLHSWGGDMQITLDQRNPPQPENRVSKSCNHAISQLRTILNGWLMNAKQEKWVYFNVHVRI